MSHIAAVFGELFRFYARAVLKRILIIIITSNVSKHWILIKLSNQNFTFAIMTITYHNQRQNIFAPPIRKTISLKTLSNDRINRSQMCNSYMDGGVKMSNTECFFTSLKITWIRRMYNGFIDVMCFNSFLSSVPLSECSFLLYGYSYLEKYIDLITILFGRM